MVDVILSLTFFVKLWIFYKACHKVAKQHSIKPINKLYVEWQNQIYNILKVYTFYAGNTFSDHLNNLTFIFVSL